MRWGRIGPGYVHRNFKAPAPPAPKGARNARKRPQDRPAPARGPVEVPARADVPGPEGTASSPSENPAA